MIGLPIVEKFGFNEPASGFLNETEVAILKRCLSDQRLAYLEEYALKSEEACGIRDWVLALPDISEEEFEKQIREFDDFMREHTRPPQ